MLLTYLIGRRFWPRVSVPATLVFAITFVATQAGFTWATGTFGITKPVFGPKVHFGDRRAEGGDAGIPVSKIITLTGVASFVLSPFGGYALNLAAITAAITAAICMGPEAHPEPRRRYTAAVVCGAIYIVIGCFGAAVTGVLTAFPKELVAAIARLALLGTIGSALLTAMQDEKQR